MWLLQKILGMGKKRWKRERKHVWSNIIGSFYQLQMLNNQEGFVKIRCLWGAPFSKTEPLTPCVHRGAPCTVHCAQCTGGSVQFLSNVCFHFNKSIKRRQLGITALQKVITQNWNILFYIFHPKMWFLISAFLISSLKKRRKFENI